MITHAVPPICGEMSDVRGISARCDNYDSTYDLSGEIMGQGSYGQVEKIKIKDSINRSDDSRPRFWNPELSFGIIKLMSGSVRGDKIFRMYREAIISQAIQQRIKSFDLSLAKHYTYAVDVYGDGDDRDGNIVMQPLADRTLDDPFYQLLFKGEQKMAKILTKKLLQIAWTLHRVGGHFHLDIKPSNILVSGNSLIFTDWGTAMPAQQDGTFSFDSAISSGTATYSAPECIAASTNRKDGTPVNGEKADVFMIGATIFWLLFGQHHFPPDLQHIYVVAFYMVHGYGGPVIQAESPPCNAICQIFFNKMLSKDPALRMTIQEALEHPWLEEVASGSDDATGELDLTIPAEAEVVFDPASLMGQAGPSEGGNPSQPLVAYAYPANPRQQMPSSRPPPRDLEPAIPPQFHGGVPTSLQGPGLFPPGNFESLRPHSSPPIPAPVLNMHSSPGLSFGSVPTVGGFQGPVPLPRAQGEMQVHRIRPSVTLSPAQQAVLSDQQAFISAHYQAQLQSANLAQYQAYLAQYQAYLQQAYHQAAAGRSVPGPSNLQQQQAVDPAPLYQGQGALSMVLPRDLGSSNSPQQAMALGAASSANPAPVQLHVQQGVTVPERPRSQSEPSSLLAQETLSQESDEQSEGPRH